MSYDNAEGLVFNIAHGSLIDGWGIRTTIFLKGCPLRCVWCCNPEGQHSWQELKVVSSHCNGCGKCLKCCEMDAITFDKDGVILIDRVKCSNCGVCIDYCDFGALDSWGRRYTVREMFDIVNRDKPFYLSSGGGLTIGGGEATQTPGFCLGLIELCHNEGYSVAIDTCGYITTEPGRRVLDDADLLLVDLKGMDRTAHYANTGVYPEHIHSLMRDFSDAGKPMIIRLPVIPNYNDSFDEITAAACFIATLKSVERVDILPMHEYGRIKYEQIGFEYRLVSQPVPEERQQELLSIFTGHGVAAQIGSG